jgi:hypothetical protein
MVRSKAAIAVIRARGKGAPTFVSKWALSVMWITVARSTFSLASTSYCARKIHRVFAEAHLRRQLPLSFHMTASRSTLPAALNIRFRDDPIGARATDSGRERSSSKAIGIIY